MIARDDTRDTSTRIFIVYSMEKRCNKVIKSYTGTGGRVNNTMFRGITDVYIVGRNNIDIVYKPSVASGLSI